MTGRPIHRIIAALAIGATFVLAGGCATAPAARDSGALAQLATMERAKKLHVAQALSAAELAEGRADYDVAVEHYNRALRIEPNNSLAIAARGRVIFMRDKNHAVIAADTDDQPLPEPPAVTREQVVAEYESWMKMSQTALAIHDFAAANDYVQQAIDTLTEHELLFNPDAHTDKMRKLSLLVERIRDGRKLAEARNEARQIADGQ